MIKSIPWSSPDVHKEELSQIIDSFDADWLTMGPKVKKFEKQMAEFMNVPYACAVSNGTIAIDIALKIIGIKHDDEVIVPAMTYFSTASAVNRVGAIPVFVDIEENSWGLNPARLEEAITEKTKAILFIDYGGNPADIDGIFEVAKTHNIPVIQDAAQSLGGIYKGSPLGSQARISTMSFHMAKILSTVEGGMIFTHDKSVADQIRIYRNQGESAKYKHSVLGYNARMTDIAAGIGLSQVNKLNHFLKARKSIAEKYDNYFNGNDKILLSKCTRENCSHANFLYSIAVENRDFIVDELKKDDIDTRICYPMPLYEQELYKSGRERCRYLSAPISERITSQTIALPIFPSMEDDQIDKVANCLIKALDKI
tara:strand:- start:1934 stop:3040 length:1107 start_codon:yes stop_codon:yes gene_type:complete